MSHTRVLNLRTVQNADLAAVGPKAMSLVHLSRIGIPVPPGFCVLGAAYREHLEENGLIPHISSSVDQLSNTSSRAKSALLSALRLAILEPPLTSVLRNEIEDHYRALGADRVAVRSSATAEDLPGYSFAGQYETYLGVAGLEDCIEAIKKCWASLWTERAYDYRDKNGFDHLALDMAVIVQSVLQPHASGVVFTMDPVSGRSDRLVMEACFGLGDSLVSGRVVPDRFILEKENLRILSQTLSEKAVKSVVGGEGGVEEQAVPADRARAPSVGRSTVRRLGRLAKRAEAALGSPQDMEWAVQGRKVFFLQSRPITGLRGGKSWEDRQVWTNANIGEVVPDVVTPANWFLVKVLGTAVFDSVFRWIGIDFKDNQLVGKVAGRAYFNINTFEGALRHFPGLRKMDLSQVLGGEQGRLVELGELEIPESDIPDFGFSRLRFIFKMPLFAFRVLAHSPRRGAQYVADMKERGEHLLRIDIGCLPDETIVAHLRSAVDEIYENVHGIAFSGLGMFHFTQLAKACKKWLGDGDGTFANRLLAGMGDMDIARAGLELWRLAARAQESPAVRRAVLSGDSWGVTRKRISNLEGGDEFLRCWDRFMGQHGHHTRGELEVYNPRWSEMPDYILETVRAYLKSTVTTNPLEHYEKRARERDELAAECRRRLKNPFRRLMFNFYLNQAQRGCVLRENIKSVAVVYWAAIRSMLLELGERFAKRGITGGRDDIFFLEFDEVVPVIRGEAEFKVRETVASRRAEYERNMRITPPKVVVGKFDTESFVPEDIDCERDSLTGIPVCPGIVTGPARVILKTNTNERILPGEILVAPFTDPGWTPYLLPAAGIVVDQGGLLSHGSIIAREYGIPTVVNVGPATRLITTGQTIQVDGTRGYVRILR